MPARDEQRSARDIAASHAVTTADTRASWRWATARTGVDPRGTLNKEENRALSKASGGAGGFVVPTDFDQAIIAAARPTRVLGALAREITTTHGRTITVPSATTHGTGAWVAENANEAAASDETFAQTTLGAFKARTKVIASEELAHDVPGSFDEVIAAELGPRLAAVEEPAFIAGDGSGKPLGIVHTSSPYTTVTAATGNVTNLNWAAYIAAAKALPASYRQNATWALSVDAFSNLAGLLDTAGSPIRNADSGRLLGF